ncbi:MAG: hypothetical protein U1F36_07010 [Planctomycetota bacterium]
MPDTGRATIEAASTRLRGVLVRTPLVGEPCLPVRGVLRGVRLKLECLQPGGSLWFRGAMHALARRLGSLPRIEVDAGGDQAPAFAHAAALLRIECIVRGRPRTGLRAQLVALGARFDAGALQAERPSPDDPDFRSGIATLGLELAAELPLDVEEVHVDARVAAAIAAGLRCASRDLRVVPVEVDVLPVQGLARDLLRGLRVAPHRAGLAALASALGVGGRPVAAVV